MPPPPPWASAGTVSQRPETPPPPPDPEPSGASIASSEPTQVTGTPVEAIPAGEDRQAGAPEAAVPNSPGTAGTAVGGLASAHPPLRVTAGRKWSMGVLVFAGAVAATIIVAIVLTVLLPSHTASSSAYSEDPAATSTAEPDAPSTAGGGDADSAAQAVTTTTGTTVPPTTQALPPAKVLSRVPTTDPVVFLTIDDGWVLLPDLTAALTNGSLPATVFPVTQAMKKNTATWQEIAKGTPIFGNHTISHPKMDSLSLEKQTQEICKASETIREITGRFPIYFRPPYGRTDKNTAIAAGRCGIKYVLKWSAGADKGKIGLDEGTTMRPGDIVLMHFRPMQNEDVAAVKAAAEAAGLHLARLEDYLS